MGSLQSDRFFVAFVIFVVVSHPRHFGDGGRTKKTHQVAIPDGLFRLLLDGN